MKRAILILFFAIIITVPFSLWPSEPKPNNTLNNKDEIFTNSIGMKFKLIKAGEFMMGSDNGGQDEKPVHKVMISKDFYLGICEVTQAQYKRIMGENPSYFRAPDLPVETVSWDDAQEFCRKLSQKEGEKYRLPTEAEWEYACRAGTTTEFFWGDKSDDKHTFKVDNTKGKTGNIRSKKPNPWGLYDMSGNVWEWCLDWYSEKTYRNGEYVDPQGAQEGQYRIIRGGSWDYCNMCCRSAYRGSRSPETKSFTIGFRVVLMPKQ